MTTQNTDDLTDIVTEAPSQHRNMSLTLALSLGAVAVLALLVIVIIEILSRRQRKRSARPLQNKLKDGSLSPVDTKDSVINMGPDTAQPKVARDSGVYDAIDGTIMMDNTAYISIKHDPTAKQSPRIQTKKLPAVPPTDQDQMEFSVFTLPASGDKPYEELPDTVSIRSHGSALSNENQVTHSNNSVYSELDEMTMSSRDPSIHSSIPDISPYNIGTQNNVSTQYDGDQYIPDINPYSISSQYKGSDDQSNKQNDLSINPYRISTPVHMSSQISDELPPSDISPYKVSSTQGHLFNPHSEQLTVPDISPYNIKTLANTSSPPSAEGLSVPDISPYSIGADDQVCIKPSERHLEIMDTIQEESQTLTENEDNLVRISHYEDISTILQRKYSQVLDNSTTSQSKSEDGDSAIGDGSVFGSRPDSCDTEHEQELSSDSDCLSNPDGPPGQAETMSNDSEPISHHKHKGRHSAESTTYM